jgi:cytochrome c-type biogenesis protein
MPTAQVITYPMALVAGLLSFITPCVLPLVPVYLSILSGTSFSQLTAKEGDLTAAERAAIHQKVISNAIAFIIGFSIVFIVAGLFAAVIGGFVQAWGDLLLRIIAVVVIIFGMNMSGFWKPRMLNMEARFHIQKGKLGLLSSLLIGAAFAFGWTPCVGPILGPILVIAAGTGNKLQGALMLATYSLGLAIPFFLSALSVNGLIAFSGKMKKHFGTFELVLGSILIFIGLYLLIGGEHGLNAIRSGLENLFGSGGS